MNYLLLMYCQTDVIGIIFLSLLLVNQRKAVGMSSSQNLFNTLIYLNIAVFVIDILMILLEGSTFYLSSQLLYVITTCYFICSAFIPYAWVKYSFYSAVPHFDKRHRYNLLNFIFLLFSLSLILINFFQPILFYLTDLNSYQRGFFYVLFISLPLVLSLYSSFITYKASRVQKNETRKKELLLLSSFGIILFIATYLQSIFFGVSIVWITITIFIYIIHMNIQNRAISLDPLTKLNNRYALDHYMERKLKESNSTFALCMIDVDKFKAINDTYGHACGDAALAYIGKAMIKACKDEKAFLARYGGDEFVIVLHFHSEEQLLEVKRNIALYLRDTTYKYQLPYELNISFGFAIWKDQKTLKELLEEADLQMYLEKRAIER